MVVVVGCGGWGALGGDRTGVGLASMYVCMYVCVIKHAVQVSFLCGRSAFETTSALTSSSLAHARRCPRCSPGLPTVQGWIPLHVIGAFNRVRMLTPDPLLIVSAMQASAALLHCSTCVLRCAALCVLH